MMRRIIPIVCSIAVLCATIPAPASAGTSTAQEVQIGQQYDKDIIEQSNVVSDPMLNAWVNDVSGKLWPLTARKDVPYSIKILDVPDVNAFSTMGGFVYINEGTLDFAQSDDELAGVIAHETGHIERRHAITMQSRAGLINLVLGIGSLFSPFLYRFGQLIQAGAVARVQRTDEYEADKYGLLLMTRAGYDPQAMVSFMKHLGAFYGTSGGLLDKYLADHPDSAKRVNSLVGYPQLDPKDVTPDQRLAAAIHDEETGRYAIASREYTELLKTNPDNSIAQFHLGQAQLALGQTSKGEQNLSEAATKGSDQTRTLAQVRIRALRDGERRRSLTRVDLAPLRAAVAAAQASSIQAAAAVGARRDSGRDQLKSLESRVQNISYGIPDYSRVQRRPGSRFDTVMRNFATMGRAIDTATGKASESISGLGSLERNKEGGLLKENSDILAELAAPLKSDTIPPQVLATLPNYMRMLADLEAAHGDMIRAVDAARASLAMLDNGLGDLDTFVRQFARVGFDGSGDMSIADYKSLEPLMTKAIDSINKAAVASSQASQLFNMARSRQLATHITLLGLASSPDRFATLDRALEVRFKTPAIDYDALVHGDLTPGDVAAASIIAADTNTSPAAIVAEAKATNRSVIDIANARGMQAEALEIMLGLVYLDYTDDPDKEARGHT